MPFHKQKYGLLVLSHVDRAEQKICADESTSYLAFHPELECLVSLTRLAIGPVLPNHQPNFKRGNDEAKDSLICDDDFVGRAVLSSAALGWGESGGEPTVTQQSGDIQLPSGAPEPGIGDGGGTPGDQVTYVWHHNSYKYTIEYTWMLLDDGTYGWKLTDVQVEYIGSNHDHEMK